MKRKDYKQPAIRIVKLQPRKMLLSSPDASISAKRGGYGTATTDTWGDDE